MNAVAIDRVRPHGDLDTKAVTPIDLISGTPIFHTASTDLLEELPKNGDVPNSSFLPIGRHGAIGRHIFKSRPWF